MNQHYAVSSVVIIIINEKKCFMCGKKKPGLKEVKIPGLYTVFVCATCDRDKS